MLDLFIDKVSPKTGFLYNPAMLAAGRQFEYTCKTLGDYYAGSNGTLSNTHVLVQALRMLSFAADTEFDHIWSTLYARAPYVAKYFGFTNSFSFGKAHSKVFYGGSGFKEYILDAPLLDVDLTTSKKEWVKADAMRVLYHPAKDFHMLLPCGDNMPYRDNYSVVQVDLILLALQFHHYKALQRTKYGLQARLSPSSFLLSEALPRLYKSHVDLVIANNLFEPGGFMTKGEDSGIGWPPVSFPDFSGRVKAPIQEANTRIRKSSPNYLLAMYSVPMLVEKTMVSLMFLPKMPLTRQCTWLFWLARFRYIFEMIRLGGDKGIKNNRQIIANLKRDLNYFLADKSYLLFKDEKLEEEFLYFAGYVSNL